MRLGLFFGDFRAEAGNTKLYTLGDLFMRSRLLGLTFKLIVGELGSSLIYGLVFCLNGHVKFN